MRVERRRPRAVGAVHTERAVRELRHRGLRNEHGAGASQRRDHCRVGARRRIVGEYARACMRDPAFAVETRLHRQHRTGQRRGAAVTRAPVPFVRLGERRRVATRQPCGADVVRMRGRTGNACAQPVDAGARVAPFVVRKIEAVHA